MFRAVLVLSELLTSQWSVRNTDMQEGETIRDGGPTRTTNFRFFCQVTTVFDKNAFLLYRRKKMAIYCFIYGYLTTLKHFSVEL